MGIEQPWLKRSLPPFLAPTNYRYLRSGYRLPPMIFTDEEALGLALGLLAARHLGLAGVAPAVEGALAKLERVMSEALRRRVRALQETLSIAAGRPQRPARSEALL